MENQKIIFFRNDDVGLHSDHEVSAELKSLTNLFIEEDLPIAYGVVPGAINSKTIDWLNEAKSKYPKLIEVDQHGYKHTDYNGFGEFGANRDYAKQKKDILAGLRLMEQYFGKYFSYVFSPPWYKYDGNTKRICDELGFKIISGAVSPKSYARIFYKIGHLLDRNWFLGRPVSYHKRNHFSQRRFNIREISVGIGVDKNVKLKKMKSYEEIHLRYQKCKKYYNVIGFCLHDSVFDSEEKLNIIRKLLINLKKDVNLSFRLIEEISN